jgi:hypothetical protein
MQAYAALGVDEFIVPAFNLGNVASQIATLDRFITDVAER